MANLLIINNDASGRESLASALKELGHDVRVAASGTDGLNAFIAAPASVVFLGVSLGDIDPFILAEDLRGEDGAVRVILVLPGPDIDLTVRALREGMSDVLYRPLVPSELQAALEKSASSPSSLFSRVAENGFPEEAAPGLIGQSPAMQALCKGLATVALSQAGVLLIGERGTEKERIARILHRHTAPEEPFVSVSCSAATDGQLEPELFGYEKGSFAGAFSRKPGKVESARGGTLFLDEIGDLSLPLQARLLRVLQEKEFERAGGKDRIRFRARVVAASHGDLHPLVRQGLFRDDLYYCLNIASLRVPPLRERRDDIPLWVDHILKRMRRDLAVRVSSVADEVLALFNVYDWPGNVQELENALMRAAAQCRSSRLTRRDFPDLVAATEAPEAGEDEAGESAAAILTLDQVEERHIRQVLQGHSGRSKGDLCALLGISRPTLERKLEKYGIAFGRES